MRYVSGRASSVFQSWTRFDDLEVSAVAEIVETVPAAVLSPAPGEALGYGASVIPAAEFQAPGEVLGYGITAAATTSTWTLPATADTGYGVTEGDGLWLLAGEALGYGVSAALAPGLLAASSAKAAGYGASIFVLEPGAAPAESLGYGLTAAAIAAALLGEQAIALGYGVTFSLAAQRVLVMNAETAAISEYRLPVRATGLAQFDGVFYVASDEGLFAMDAEQDESGAVDWTLITGFSNLGDDRIKRIRDLNVLASGGASMTVTPTLSSLGVKSILPAYSLPTMPRGTLRDGVIKIGRGAKGVYWSFQIAGTGPAEIDEIRIAVELLGRRRYS